MTTIAIYDPALCCPTGVCGPEIDPKLAQFAADLQWLQANGVAVTRYNLAQNPAAFVMNATVKTALTDKGEDALPLVLVNDRVLASGAYPSGADLAAAAGLAPGTVPAATAEDSGCCGGDGEEKAEGGCCGDGDAQAAGGDRCCG